MMSRSEVLRAHKDLSCEEWPDDDIWNETSTSEDEGGGDNPASPPLKPFKHPPISPSKRQIRLLHIPFREIPKEIARSAGIPKKYMLPLVGLQDARDDDTDIVAHMKVVSLDDAPKYLALSYVWNYTSPRLQSTPSTGYISLGGRLGNRSIRTGLPLTPNLESAIRHLRIVRDQAAYGLFCETGHLVLWVDALCINQNDDAEREWQVQLMGDIYSKAAAVFSWLGPGDESTDRAIDAAFVLDRVTKARVHERLGCGNGRCRPGPETHDLEGLDALPAGVLERIQRGDLSVCMALRKTYGLETPDGADAAVFPMSDIAHLLSLPYW
jgi:hypothetical protein